MLGENDVIVDFNDSKLTFFNNSDIIINLIMFAFIWATASFNYYLIHFYSKYIPGNFFFNNMIIALSELISDSFPGLFLDRMGIKLSMISSLLLSAIGGSLIIWVKSGGYIFGVFVLLAKTGINWLFSNCYICTALVFPTHLRSRAYGICNIMGRIITMFCPLVAEIDPPYPMIVFTVSCLFALIPSVFIRAHTHYE